MNETFYLVVHACNQKGTERVGLYPYESIAEAEADLAGWLSSACGFSCYRGEPVEEELSFRLPTVETVADFTAYNGYYGDGVGGFINLFLMPIWDEGGAMRFRRDSNREFELDKTFTDEADEMMDTMDLFVSCVTEKRPVPETAMNSINHLLKQGGLSLF